MNKSLLASVALAITLLVPPGIMHAQDHTHHAGAALPAQSEPVAPQSAVAVLVATKGNTVSGVVRFTQTDKGVRVVAEVTGLSPGDHGFHVHEFGDLTSSDGTSAGGHFNPTQAKHGAPDAGERHIGDLGNLKADAEGRATLDYVDPLLKLDGPHSILGRGLVVHASADDLKSQPTGNAGARVAVGVIGVAKP